MRVKVQKPPFDICNKRKKIKRSSKGCNPLKNVCNTLCLDRMAGEEKRRKKCYMFVIVSNRRYFQKSGLKTEDDEIIQQDSISNMY
jgi:hypothetical protein